MTSACLIGGSNKQRSLPEQVVVEVFQLLCVLHETELQLTDIPHSVVNKSEVAITSLP